MAEQIFRFSMQLFKNIEDGQDAEDSDAGDDAKGDNVIKD